MGSKKQKIEKQARAERKRAGDEHAPIDYDAIVTGTGGKSYTMLNKLLKAAGAKGGPFRSFYNGSMPEPFVQGMRAALERAGKPLTTGGKPKAPKDDDEQGERLRAAPREPDPALLRKPSWLVAGVSVRVVSAGRRQGRVGRYVGDLAEGYVNVDLGRNGLDRYAFYPGELEKADG